MKTSKILLQTDKSNHEETPKKLRADKLSKYILVIFMLSWITLLSSCIAFVPVGHDGHGSGHGHDGGHRGFGGERHERHG